MYVCRYMICFVCRLCVFKKSARSANFLNVKYRPIKYLSIKPQMKVSR